MSHASTTASSLLGALCIAEGLITPAQLRICQARHMQDHNGQPLSLLMVQLGFLSETDLARMLARQRSFRQALVACIEHATSEDTTLHQAAIGASSLLHGAIPELQNDDLGITDSWLFP